MLRQRSALVVAAAAAAAALLGLVGRIEMSVPAALLLLLASRVASLNASGEHEAVRTGATVGALVPAWVLISITAVVRANSADLADVRGTSAVAGLPLTHGEPIVVLACWLALVAGVLSLAGSIPRAGLTTAGDPSAQAELISLAGLTLLLVALFAGPHVGRASDLLPWVLGFVVIGGSAWLVRGVLGPWSVRASSLLAFAAAIGIAVSI